MNTDHNFFIILNYIKATIRAHRKQYMVRCIYVFHRCICYIYRKSIGKRDRSYTHSTIPCITNFAKFSKKIYCKHREHIFSARKGWERAFLSHLLAYICVADVSDDGNKCDTIDLCELHTCECCESEIWWLQARRYPRNYSCYSIGWHRALPRREYSFNLNYKLWKRYRETLTRMDNVWGVPRKKIRR